MEKYLKEMLDGCIGNAVQDFVRNAVSIPAKYEDTVSTLSARFSEKAMQAYGIGDFIAPYFEAKRKQLRDRIVPCIHEVVQNNYSWLKPQEDGTYHYEMFAYPDDRLNPGSIQGFLEKEDPELALYEHLEWLNDEVKTSEMQKLVQEVVDMIDDPDLDDDVEMLVQESLSEIFFMDPPMDHYLNQEVCVNIQIDTGTGSRGFYEIRRDNGELDDQSAILWLVKQQGYSEEDFRTALKLEDYAGPNFLVSAKSEIENATYDDNALTFLVQMTVGQLLKIAAAVKMQDRNGEVCDAAKIPDCGTITLGKSTNCGLYNPWNGSGGPIEIELDRDVVLPIAFIHDLVVEYNSHKVGGPYLMMNAFGMCRSMWRDTLVSIDPIKLEEE